MGQNLNAIYTSERMDEFDIWNDWRDFNYCDKSSSSPDSEQFSFKGLYTI